MPIQMFSNVGPLGNNVYVVYDADTNKALQVDCAMQSEPVWDWVVQQGLSLEYIVKTHGSVDHIWNNAFFKVKAPDAKLLIHHDDKPLLENLVESARRWGVEPKPSPPADDYLGDGMKLEVGNLSLKVLHTPGHTPGSSSLYLEGVLISGDTLFRNSIGRYHTPGGSLQALLGAIKTKLLVLPGETAVLPGHGPATDINEERANNPFLQECAVERMGLA